MSATTLTLSGWTQPADALAAILPDAAVFQYSAFASPKAAIEALRDVPAMPHVVGWSLGGQLALRAIAEGVLRPRHLTLIATPWQFVGPGGMGKETFTLFRESYQRDPARSMERFAGLVAKNDTRQREILRDFRHHPSADDAARWLPWLDALAEYHPDAAFLEQLPPTLAIHGEADAIVPVAQAEQFCALPNVTISRWEGTGHAPHLHDPARLAREIAEHRRAQKAAA